MTRESVRSPVPAVVWWVASIVVALRMLPWIVGSLTDAGPDKVFIPAMFVSDDFAQYAAMIRQTGEDHAFLLNNPFTTEAQQPRFVLLFFEALGLVQRATGLSALTVLELSRIPLIVAFFVCWWRFIEAVISDPRARLWALWLTALGGGLDYIPWGVANFCPPAVADFIRINVYTYNGWSFFGQVQNPIWLAAWLLALPILKRVLQPHGPSERWDPLIIFACFVTLAFTHPYTALFVGVLSAVLGVLRRKSVLRSWIPLGLGALLVAGVTAWQMQDAVFRKSAGGLLGDRNSWCIWYPFTLGAVGVFAWLGWKKWSSDAHPWKAGIFAWVVCASILHQSPFTNGYKFIMYLFLPLVLLAAEPLSEAISRWRTSGGAAGRWKSALVIFLIFSSAPITAARSISKEELDGSRFSAEAWSVVQWFKTQPAARVYCSEEIGLLLPAFTPHHTYMGHSFLTPNYFNRVVRYVRQMNNPDDHAAELRKIIQNDNIEYAVVPAKLAVKFEELLSGKTVFKTEQWAVLTF